MSRHKGEHKWETYPKIKDSKELLPDVYCSICGIFAVIREGKYLVEPLPVALMTGNKNLCGS